MEIYLHSTIHLLFMVFKQWGKCYNQGTNPLSPSQIICFSKYLTLQASSLRWGQCCSYPVRQFSLLAFPKMSNLIAFSFSLCRSASLCLTSFVHFTLSLVFLLTQHTLPSSFISVRSSYSSSFTCSNSKADWQFSFLFQQFCACFVVCFYWNLKVGDIPQQMSLYTS